MHDTTHDHYPAPVIETAELASTALALQDIANAARAAIAAANVDALEHALARLDTVSGTLASVAGAR